MHILQPHPRVGLILQESAYDGDRFTTEITERTEKDRVKKLRDLCVLRGEIAFPGQFLCPTLNIFVAFRTAVLDTPTRNPVP